MTLIRTEWDARRRISQAERDAPSCCACGRPLPKDERRNEWSHYIKWVCPPCQYQPKGGRGASAKKRTTATMDRSRRNRGSSRLHHAGRQVRDRRHGEGRERDAGAA